MSTKNRFATRVWVTIGGVAGLVAIIGIIVAVAQYVGESAFQRIAQETQQSALETQQSAQKTQQSTLSDQRLVQIEIATQLAYSAETGATGTAAAQKIKELLSTGETSQIVLASPTVAPSQTSVPPTNTTVPPPKVFVVDPFSVPTNLTGGTGGEEFEPRKCPEMAVAKGIVGRSGVYIDQIKLFCQQLNHDGSMSNIWDTLTAGGNGGEPFKAVGCPPNFFIVGITGRSGTVIDSIGTIKCADVWGHSREINVGVGGGGGGNFEAICPQGYAVTGFSGRFGGHMDQLFLLCNLIRQQ